MINVVAIALDADVQIANVFIHWSYPDKMERGNHFANGIDGEPEPTGGCDATYAGIEFVQLKHDEDQIAEQLVVSEL